MEYVIFLLNLVLFLVLGLTALANGAGLLPLKPVQDALKPVVTPLAGFVGTLAIVGVIWGVFGVIQSVLIIEFLFRSFRLIVNLLGWLVLITVAVLAGYAAVAAFFGAPASGAGKFIDWIKRTFGPIEAIVGIVALIYAIWLIVEFAVYTV